METKNKLLPTQPTPINIRQEIERVNRIARRFQTSDFFKRKNGDGAQSSFFDEWTVTNNLYGNLKTADGHINREVDCKTLRRVSKKAWIINLCIINVQKKSSRFLNLLQTETCGASSLRKSVKMSLKRQGKSQKSVKKLNDF